MTIQPPLTADFDSIQTNIFTPICAGCHSGPNPAANLNLDATHSYNELVNVPSTEEPMLDRVKPGNPADSYLVIHLKSDGDGAPASDIPFVVQWIMDGALPSSQATPMSAESKSGEAMRDSGFQGSAGKVSRKTTSMSHGSVFVNDSKELPANVITVQMK